MGESGCFRYFDDRSEIAGLIAEIRDNHSAAGAGGEDFSWNAVLGKYLEPAIGEAVSCTGPAASNDLSHLGSAGRSGSGPA